MPHMRAVFYSEVAALSVTLARSLLQEKWSPKPHCSSGIWKQQANRLPAQSGALHSQATLINPGVEEQKFNEACKNSKSMGYVDIINRTALV